MSGTETFKISTFLKGFYTFLNFNQTELLAEENEPLLYKTICLIKSLERSFGRDSKSDFKTYCLDHSESSSRVNEIYDEVHHYNFSSFEDALTFIGSKYKLSFIKLCKNKNKTIFDWIEILSSNCMIEKRSRANICSYIFLNSTEFSVRNDKFIDNTEFFTGRNFIDFNNAIHPTKMKNSLKKMLTAHKGKVDEILKKKYESEGESIRAVTNRYDTNKFLDGALYKKLSKTIDIGILKAVTYLTNYELPNSSFTLRLKNMFSHYQVVRYTGGNIFARYKD